MSCSICVQILKSAGKHLATVSICGHVFHQCCLETWMDRCSKFNKYTCPMCNQICERSNVTRLYIPSDSEEEDEQSDDDDDSVDNPDQMANSGDHTVVTTARKRINWMSVLLLVKSAIGIAHSLVQIADLSIQLWRSIKSKRVRKRKIISVGYSFWNCCFPQ
ncbi:RING-H2 finger protein ATL57-like isoform X2 [Mercurialis annua]|uniref:RING-H2 finger protein ATL57-like isoform X2 n=2 Tax=Mercurialis annua TaxID=3986 RepID=UPI002160C5A0|nr:RING-H2 finger protein ATL57-like isoform X2 [Mercurialis annua]